MASMAETRLKGRDYAQEASESLFDQIENLRALGVLMGFLLRR